MSQTPKKLKNDTDLTIPNFTPYMSREDAIEFGGPLLSDYSVFIRVASMIASQSKEELLNGAGKDISLLADTIENLTATREFIKQVMDVNERALTRLVAISYVVEPD